MKRLYNWLADKPALILTGCSIVFLALGWGQDGINLDSGTYAVVARNMAEFGQWFAPHYTQFCHPAFAEHPPLVLWMQGLIFLILPPNDTTARLFGALCSLGSVLVVFAIGRRIVGRSYGFLCGLILLLTYNFMQIGNSTLLDVPMTFFILIALYGIVRMNKEGINTRNALMTGMALGAAWLAKGVVSAPVWIALGAFILFWKRSWFSQGRFWLIPAVALAMAAAHLGLDQIFADGHFFEYYFFRQIGDRFTTRTARIDTEWWEFSYRFAKLYLPFIALVPIGIYQLIRKHHKGLYPILIALIFYIILYSGAARLYYHYFCPSYALAAPLAALPLIYWLKENHIRRISVGFLAIWLALGIGIRVSGMPVHELRTKEIYSLTDPMLSLLDRAETRDGCSVGQGEKNWDYISKVSWYWRSDLDQVESVDDAVAGLNSGKYAYILAENSHAETMQALTVEYADQLRTALSNDRVTLFFPKEIGQQR